MKVGPLKFMKANRGGEKEKRLYFVEKKGGKRESVFILSGNETNLRREYNLPYNTSLNHCQQGYASSMSHCISV